MFVGASTHVEHRPTLVAHNLTLPGGSRARAQPTVGRRRACQGWFVGQVMKSTGGKANPAAVNDILKKKLGIEA